MKRTITSIFAIMLALAMVMSLAACGGSGGEGGEKKKSTENDIDINEFAIGTWECSYTATEDDDFGFHNYSAGDKLIRTFEFFEGGVYKYDFYNATKKKNITNIRGEWAAKDGYVKLTTNLTESFKPDYQNGTLTDVTDKNLVFSKK